MRGLWLPIRSLLLLALTTSGLSTTLRGPLGHDSESARRALPAISPCPGVLQPRSIKAQTAAYSTPDSSVENPLLFQGFEWYIPKDQKHWQRLASVVPQLHQIGVGQLWIPPPTKAATIGSIGYDVYDLWDLGEFETHGQTATAMGNKADLMSLATAAHQAGIGIVVDASLNQRSGADFTENCAITRLNPNNRLQPINPTKMADIWTGFNYTSRGRQYSSKQWGCDDFTAIDFDASTGSHGVFKINGIDNDFATDVDTKDNGNYDYLTLTDVAYEQPSVQEDVKLWGTWIAQLLGASGFRMDAAKHISREFMKDWITNTASAIKTGVQDPLIVAEYWTSTLSELLGYVNGIGDVARVFDVPLLNHFAEIANEQASLLTMFEESVAATQPDSAVTLVGNHDTQLGQASDSLYVQDWFRPFAYAFILLRQEGIPCVFYADIFGVCDQTGSCAKANNSEAVGKLSTARAFFAYGQQIDYNSTDVSTVGWVRQGESSHPDGTAVTMSLSKEAPSSKAMNVGQSHADETWYDILGNSKDVKISSKGVGTFPVPARGLSVFVNKARWDALSLSNWDFNIYG